MTLKLRPEELTRTDISRSTVTQTLGGAFIDSFGKGLPTVQISGHTGWRGRTAAEMGPAYFEKLKKFVYDDWHTSRATALKNNSDPDKIKLIFSDLLDNFQWVVVPMNFTLKRNTSNPLLSYYQMNLAWVSDYVAEDYGVFSGIKSIDDILKSMDAALAKIDNFAAELESDIDGFFDPITDGIKAAMNVAFKINQQARSLVGSGSRILDSVTGNLINTATGLSYAAANMLGAIIAVGSFPEYAKFRLMNTKSAWMNLFCIFQNSIRPQRLLPNFNDVYGASLCSSTTGGRPLLKFQNANTFENVLPLNQSGTFTMNNGAVNAMNQINGFDTVISPPSIGQLNALSLAISQGTQGL